MSWVVRVDEAVDPGLVPNGDEEDFMNTNRRREPEGEKQVEVGQRYQRTGRVPSDWEVKAVFRNWPGSAHAKLLSRRDPTVSKTLSFDTLRNPVHFRRVA